MTTATGDAADRDQESSPDQPQDSQPGHSILITLGHTELALRKRYEVLSILNDLLVAAWFVAGSILFFDETTTKLGTWFFLIGSIQLMLRPAIRLSRRIHLRRLDPAAPRETIRDF